MKFREWIAGSMLMAATTIIVACAAPVAAPAAEAPAAEAPAAEEPGQWCPPNSAVSGSVSFMSWAENDYEEWALNKMVEQFRAVCPTVTVELTIVR